MKWQLVKWVHFFNQLRQQIDLSKCSCGTWVDFVASIDNGQVVVGSFPCAARCPHHFGWVSVSKKQRSILPSFSLQEPHHTLQETRARKWVRVSLHVNILLEVTLKMNPVLITRSQIVKLIRTADTTRMKVVCKFVSILQFLNIDYYFTGKTSRAEIVSVFCFCWSQLTPVCFLKLQLANQPQIVQRETIVVGNARWHKHSRRVRWKIKYLKAFRK